MGLAEMHPSDLIRQCPGKKGMMKKIHRSFFFFFYGVLMAFSAFSLSDLTADLLGPFGREPEKTRSLGHMALHFSCQNSEVGLSMIHLLSPDYAGCRMQYGPRMEYSIL